MTFFFSLQSGSTVNIFSIGRRFYSIPGEKQNSHLRFSCGESNLTPPPFFWPKTTRLSEDTSQNVACCFNLTCENGRWSLFNDSDIPAMLLVALLMFYFPFPLLMFYPPPQCVPSPLFSPLLCLFWHCGTKWLTFLITDHTLTCRGALTVWTLASAVNYDRFMASVGQIANPFNLL